MNRAARLLAATLLLTPSLARAETLRGTLVGELTAAPNQESQQTLIGINDLLGISIGSESRFFKGIEVTVTIPSEVRRYRDMLALFVYTDIHPELSPDSQPTAGSRPASWFSPDRPGPSSISR